MRYYGGAGEFYFPGRWIGLGFGYGIVGSLAQAFDRMTYMRFGLIFAKNSKTTLYGALYGDKSWGIGLQWAGYW
jgi:hypothetical protein